MALPKTAYASVTNLNGDRIAGSGIGIGLTLARQLTEMHGGTLAAESAGAGMGSTFTIRFPLRAVVSGEADAEAAQPSQTKQRSERTHILIMDDNVDAAQMLGTLFEMGGNTVSLAYTGKDALRLAKEFQPQIAFLDIGLPDISGHDVARTLRTEQDGLEELTLVALTAWGSQRDRLESKEAGFDFHLTKPVAISAIQDILPNLAIPE